MMNPIDKFTAFIDELPENEQDDFLLHLLTNDIGEGGMDYWKDDNNFREGYETHFLSKKETPIGFTGLCLKVRAFTDHYFGRFSEESEQKQMEFFQFVRDSDKPNPPSLERLEASTKARAEYYRSILPKWEELQDEFFTDDYIGDFTSQLFAEQSPLKN